MCTFRLHEGAQSRRLQVTRAVRRHLMATHRPPANDNGSTFANVLKQAITISAAAIAGVASLAVGLLSL